MWHGYKVLIVLVLFSFTFSVIQVLQHEKISVLIFRRICEHPWVRDALDEYLDESDYIFIEELINPPQERFVRYVASFSFAFRDFCLANKE